MKIEPLSKELNEILTKCEVESFVLKFSGGSDEGYLYVIVNRNPESSPLEKKYDGKLEEIIKEWAWENYEYSGAGDGSDYGDDITYDLKNKTVSCQEWEMVERYHEETMNDLQIQD